MIYIAVGLAVAEFVIILVLGQTVKEWKKRYRIAAENSDFPCKRCWRTQENLTIHPDYYRGKKVTVFRDTPEGEEIVDEYYEYGAPGTHTHFRTRTPRDPEWEERCKKEFPDITQNEV